MFEWSEEQRMIREAVRQFVDAEIRPRRDELEHGDLPPYDIIRSLFKTFGMDAMARESLQAHGSSASGWPRSAAGTDADGEPAAESGRRRARRGSSASR